MFERDHYAAGLLPDPFHGVDRCHQRRDRDTFQAPVPSSGYRPSSTAYLRYLMVSEATPETLPAPSLYCTNTVLIFDPLALSFHALVAA